MAAAECAHYPLLPLEISSSSSRRRRCRWYMFIATNHTHACNCCLLVCVPALCPSGLSLDVFTCSRFPAQEKTQGAGGSEIPKQQKLQLMQEQALRELEAEEKAEAEAANLAQREKEAAAAKAGTTTEEDEARFKSAMRQEEAEEKERLRRERLVVEKLSPR